MTVYLITVRPRLSMQLKLLQQTLRSSVVKRDIIPSAGGNLFESVDLPLHLKIRVLQEVEVVAPSAAVPPAGEGASAQLIRGFTSLQSEPTGWNAVVRAGLPQ